ncbi:hypothetical protein [Paraburkholderia graminis]|uniref:hypothetical protein n=1 Tax=Paraburkholderia graminis TaxID=60548 RepID=UPI0038BC0521
MSTKDFDGDGFYADLERTVRARGSSWKAVSQATGVSQTTLTRMGQGRRPDAASMASLSAWAGINPADYVVGAKVADETSPHISPDTLAEIGKVLRQDTTLSLDSRQKLETIVASAYNALKG